MRRDKHKERQRCFDPWLWMCYMNVSVPGFYFLYVYYMRQCMVVATWGLLLHCLCLTLVMLLNIKCLLVASDHSITRISTLAFEVHCVCPKNFDWLWPLAIIPTDRFVFSLPFTADCHIWTITLKCFRKVCWINVKVVCWTIQMKYLSHNLI